MTANDDQARIECVQGDITREQVDAIVNAANTALRDGGGVNGAIQLAAGPGLLAECISRYPEGCATGEARITGGHRLPARYVVHTPGPVWHGGDAGEAELLASCYRESLRLAAAHGCRSIAFPAISCGIFGYPVAEGAGVALRAVRATLPDCAPLETVRFVLFDAATHRVFEAARRESAG